MFKWLFGKKEPPPPPQLLISTYFNQGPDGPEAAYLVVPRSVMQRMGGSWQDSFVKLLTVMDNTMPNWRPKHPYKVQYRDPNTGQMNQLDPAAFFNGGIVYAGTTGVAQIYSSTVNHPSNWPA